jgi:hypothetical protein
MFVSYTIACQLFFAFSCVSICVFDKIIGADCNYDLLSRAWHDNRPENSAKAQGRWKGVKVT